jgi:hypothetical protein
MGKVVKCLMHIGLSIMLVAASNGILVLFHQQWHFWSFNAGVVVLGVFMILRNTKE